MGVRLATTIFVAALGALSCSEERSLLVVELVTDFVPGHELARIRLVTLRGPQAVSLDAHPESNRPLEGIRIAELDDVLPGIYHFSVVGWRPTGELLAETEFIIEVRDTTVARILLSRSCADITCPASDEALTACRAGQCEDPRCVGGDTDACTVEPECEVAEDCEGSLACGAHACESGACVVDVATGGCTPDAWCDPVNGCQPAAPAGDGGVTDAGVVDAGTPDGGAPDGGTTSSCGTVAGELLCEDFEDGAPLTVGGQGEGGAENQSDTVRSGAWAGRYWIGDVRETRYQRQSTPLPATVDEGGLYVKADLFLSVGAALTSGWALLLSVSADEFGGDRTSFELRAGDDALVATIASSSSSHGIGMAFPRGRWVCVEMAIHVATEAEGGWTALSLDGIEMTRSSPLDTTLDGQGYSHALHGIIHAHTDVPALELLLDDVVVATEPIGCGS